MASPKLPKIITALALLSGSAFTSWRLHQPAALATASIAPRLPQAIGGWRGRDISLSERQYGLLETRDVLYREYAADAAKVLACVAVAGSDHKAAHPPEICYGGQGWKIVERDSGTRPLAGVARSMSELRIQKDGADVLVWSWYRVGDEETPSYVREQWLVLLAQLAGEAPPAALLRFSVVIRDDGVARARATLARFCEEFLPHADAALAAPAPYRESRAR